MLVVGLLLMAGCGHHPRSAEVPLAMPSAFSATGENGVLPPAHWWEALGDSTLDQLVASAFKGNMNLREARARLEAARAATDQAEADLWPQLDAEASVGEQRPRDAARPDVSLGLRASYKVDLWGRINATIEAEALSAEALAAEVQATALTLAGEVARTWYGLRAARRERALLAAQVQTNVDVLELLDTRFGNGQVRAVDILRQRQLVEATRGQLAVVEARVDGRKHRLAVLLGESPPDFIPPDAISTEGASVLPLPPPLPATGLPADLVTRRPDLRAARARALAADARAAAALSARYPRLDLTASLRTEGENADQLFDEWLRSVAGSLLAPLFTGGELAAAADEAEALSRAALYAYGEAVLIAFREVEDALVQEAAQRRFLTALGRQEELARQAAEQLRTAYFNGAASYIDVLTAVTDRQELQREVVRARSELLFFRIALYQALAGGFTVPAPSSSPPADG